MFRQYCNCTWNSHTLTDVGCSIILTIRLSHYRVTSTLSHFHAHGTMYHEDISHYHPHHHTLSLYTSSSHFTLILTSHSSHYHCVMHTLSHHHHFSCILTSHSLTIILTSHTLLTLIRNSSAYSASHHHTLSVSLHCKFTIHFSLISQPIRYPLFFHASRRSLNQLMYSVLIIGSRHYHVHWNT